MRIATCPVLPSAGTVTLAFVSLVTVSPASCAVPTHAVLAPVNPDPVTAITVPTGPVLGEIPLIAGLGNTADAVVTVNELGEKAACRELKIATWPVWPFAGTVTRTCVSLTTLRGALSDPMRAEFEPVKPEPETVMTVPTGPEVGEKPLMLCCGVAGGVVAAMNVKEPGEKAACWELKTAIWPVLPSAGTVILIWLSLTTCNEASCALPIQTELEPVKPDPFIVMTVPTGPDSGENELICCWGSVAAIAPQETESIAAAKRPTPLPRYAGQLANPVDSRVVAIVSVRTTLVK